MNKFIVGLEHVGIYTPDIKKSEDFYINTLGFELISREQCPKNGGTLLMCFIKAGSCIIELVQPVDASVAEKRTDGKVYHISLKVNDLDAAVAQLKQKGIQFETEGTLDVPIFKNGIKVIFFKGAFGERLELCQTL
jgi:catechol 2,3-dioxygenase-like lactoylglutathione lyase family enzyme